MDLSKLIDYSFRPTQKILFDEVLTRLKSVDDTSLVAGTGIGKTVIAAHIIAHLLKQYNPTVNAKRYKNAWNQTVGLKQIVFIVHRDALIDQTIEKFIGVFLSRWHHMGMKDEFNLWNSITLIKGNKGYNPIKPVVIASLQSLGNRYESYIKQKLLRSCVIIYDESHTNAFAPNGRKIANLLINGELTYKKRIGLTATPFRTKKDDYYCKEFTNAVVAPGVAELQKRGELTYVKYFAYDSPELSDPSGRWEDQLVTSEKFISHDHINFAIDKWEENGCSDMQTLVFASGIKHGQICKEVFESRGYDCELLCSDKKVSKGKDEVIDAFKDYKLKVLISVDMLDLGFDAPNARCTLMLRRTESRAKHWQMIGRIMRLCKDKPFSIYIDFVGNLKFHGAFAIPEGITLTEEIVMQPKNYTKSFGESPFKFCSDDIYGVGCGFSNHASIKHCSNCGKEFEKAPPPDFSALQGDVIRYMTPALVASSDDAIEYYQSLRKKRWVRGDDPNAAYFDYLGDQSDEGIEDDSIQSKYVIPNPYSDRKIHKEWSMGAVTGKPDDMRSANKFYQQLVVKSCSLDEGIDQDKFVDLNMYLEFSDSIYERMKKRVGKEEYKQLQETIKNELAAMATS